MVFEHIEKLKQEYTDKFVVVDDERPELRRFAELTGVVRTVNMNGRALVEFDGHENIGWYDIEIDFLKVVDKPTPKELEKKHAEPKKAVAKEPSALEKARAADSKSPAQLSVEQVLAAAREDKDGGGDTAVAAKTPQAKSATPAKDPQQMSVADVLAAVRGEKGSDASVTTPSAPASEDSEDVALIMESARRPKPSDVASEPTPTADAPQAKQPAEEETAASPSSGPLPTDTDGIIAWCREHDSD